MRIYLLFLILSFSLNWEKMELFLKLCNENKLEEAKSYIESLYSKELNIEEKCEVLNKHIVVLYSLGEIEEMEEKYLEFRSTCPSIIFSLKAQTIGYSENKIHLDIIRLTKYLKGKEDWYAKIVLLSAILHAHFIANYFDKNEIENIKKLLDEEIEFLGSSWFKKPNDGYCEILFALERYEELLDVCKWPKAFEHKKFLILLSLMKLDKINENEVKDRAKVILRDKTLLYYKNIEDIEILSYLAGQENDYLYHKGKNEKRFIYFPHRKAIYENYWKVVREYFEKRKIK